MPSRSRGGPSAKYAVCSMLNAQCWAPTGHLTSQACVEHALARASPGRMPTLGRSERRELHGHSYGFGLPRVPYFRRAVTCKPPAPPRAWLLISSWPDTGGRGDSARPRRNVNVGRSGSSPSPLHSNSSIHTRRKDFHSTRCHPPPAVKRTESPLCLL